ncbi:DUF871 family protein [Buchananella hordeovulneris]|nr:DUF871 family protein [Buchananella hordeovulneris]
MRGRERTKVAAMSYPAPPLYFSTYVSRFAAHREQLASLVRPGDYVFVCLHMGEEAAAPDYQEQVAHMCRTLHEWGAVILADVAGRTLEYFQAPDLLTVAQRLELDVVRIDYGVEVEHIRALLGKHRLCINASLIDERWFEVLRADMCATHNYYPRPETGLDLEQLAEPTARLQAADLEVLSFISGEGELRGPVGAGLPTVEAHRHLPPYVAYLDLALRGRQDGIIVGDYAISPAQIALIADYRATGVISLPVHLDQSVAQLAGQEVTLRADTPAGLFRIMESREYASKGTDVPVGQTGPRPRGSITVDNLTYPRYTGEMQIMRRDYPADSRVNVVGRVADGYELLLDLLAPGQRCKFVPVP